MVIKSNTNIYNLIEKLLRWLKSFNKKRWLKSHNLIINLLNLYFVKKILKN